MASGQVKIGILSTAVISGIMVPAIRAVPEAAVAAIASRDIQRAQEFAKKHSIPKACSYSDLLTLPIDAVYIPLPTSMIHKWAVLCAKAGKHVLVDKPLHSRKVVEDIILACEEAGVMFLDGTHFVHAARTKEVQARVRNGDIGKVRRIDAFYSFPIEHYEGNIRSDASLEPQGYLGDLGWYCVRAAVAYLGAEVTSNILSVSCTGKFLTKYPKIAQYGYGMIEFGTEEESIGFCFSFDSRGSLHQRVGILGTLGLLEVSDFVIQPNQSDVFASVRPNEKWGTCCEYTYERSVAEAGEDRKELMYPTRERITVEEPENLTQASKLIREFCRLVLEDDKESSRQWAKESLATQTILDAIMKETEKRSM